MLQSTRVAFSVARGRLGSFSESAYRSDLQIFSAFGNHQVTVFRPNLIKRVLSEHAEHYAKHDSYLEPIRMLVGEGLLVSSGEHWANSRRAFHAWLDGPALRAIYSQMQAATRDFLARLEGTSLNAVDVGNQMNAVTADIIYRSLFDEPLDADFRRTLEAEFPIFRHGAQAHAVFQTFGLPRLLSHGLRRKLAATCASMRGPAREAIRRRTQSTSKKHHLIWLLQQERQRAHKPLLTEEQLLDEVMTVLLAGHETTSASLSWALNLLAANPEWQAVVRNEITTTLTSSEVPLSALVKLTATRDTFRETMRLYPAVPVIPRLASRASRWAGRSFPAGIAVVTCPWVMHRREQLWADAHQFRPTRFSDGSHRPAISSAYMPFGSGPRACPGAGFAMQEATLILAEILRRYEILPTSSADLEPRVHITLRPPQNFRLRFRPL